MPGLLEECDEFFHTTDLYAVLSSKKDDDPQTLKKGYYKSSLKCHPDRASADDKELATKKFQVLGRVYTILSHKETKNLYDETGEIDESEANAGSKIGWDEYWRNMFKKITVEDITDFETKYKNSEEEMADLKEAYISSKGDMSIILSKVLCSFADDKKRFREIITGWISKEEVPAFDIFVNYKEPSKRTVIAENRKAEKEKKEAEKIMKTLTGKDDTKDSLAVLINKRLLDREQKMDDFYDSLMKKYGKSDKKRKTKK